jgi:hypothetical protein
MVQDQYRLTRCAILDAILNMTYCLVQDIWSSVKYDNTPTSKPNGTLNVYGYTEVDNKKEYFINSVNPFYDELLSDDVDCYASVLDDKLVDYKIFDFDIMRFVTLHS